MTASLPEVRISRKGVQRLQNGHLWVYKSDVVSAKDVAAGDFVRVTDPRGWFQGIASWSSSSQISVRLFTREDLPVDELLAMRLESALALRKEQGRSAASAERLVNGEGDLLPGLVVDRYADVLAIQTLTQAIARRQDQLVDLLLKSTGARAVVARNDVSTRRHESLSQEKLVLRGELDGQVTIDEGGVSLRVDLLEGQKTGAFLDQRDNHILAGDLARGRALDCFAYEGGFALQLARKADQVVAVDSSVPALSRLAANAKANDFDHIETVEANAFDLLRARVDAGETFDTIVLDPPAFTKSRSTVDAARRGYKEINLRAMSLLRSGGLLVSASCSYHLDEAAFAAVLQQAAIDAGRRLQILAVRGAGIDHPVLSGVPETHYLKCFFLRVL